MSEFVASNGVSVWRDVMSNRLRFSGEQVELDKLREKLAGALYGMRPSEEVAAREFFIHEASKRPWHDAERGDVWLFRSSENGRALAWRANDNWDVIDQLGRFHTRIDDVPAEMRDHSFFGWEDPSATLIYRITEETP